MAILKNGLWGGISGKLGNTVCYVVNGQQVVRLAVKSTKPATEGQRVNRAEMTMVNRFLKPFLAVVRVGYGIQSKTSRVYAYNLAVSHTKKYALKGEKPYREIDFQNVLLSKGSLRGLVEIDMEIQAAALKVSWLQYDHKKGMDKHARDRVMIVAYFEAQGNEQAQVCSDLRGVYRCEGHGLLGLSEKLAGRKMEVYVFVVAEDGRSVSNSQYVGRLGI